VRSDAIGEGSEHPDLGPHYEKIKNLLKEKIEKRRNQSHQEGVESPSNKGPQALDKKCHQKSAWLVYRPKFKKRSSASLF